MIVQTFETLESEVRSYCRAWPTVFERASGWTLVDEDGNEYLDFFAGAGVLNYGHNHPVLLERLVGYLNGRGIVHGLDMATTAKRDFLERFDELILQPRGLEYRLQFPGPTGTNAVEAALKLARKVTGRPKVVGFTNAFHGMTLGALAVTGNAMKRGGAGVPLTLGSMMPFDGFLDGGADSTEYLDSYLRSGGSGLDLPAAVIVETVQAEGGINVAGASWLRSLAAVCRANGILLIIDDIQVGCGRTGRFFSWEDAGIRPDIVCLSKSLSGSGLPMALVLVAPELDVWEPGEHNGTFRGNNAAFVTATAALELFWSDDRLTRAVERKATLLRSGLENVVSEHPTLFHEVRGRGLIQGIVATTGAIADAVTTAAFERGLVIETAGADDEVVKFLPPLIIDDDAIAEALIVLGGAVEAVHATRRDVAGVVGRMS
jgi:diaminobutyrate-2-oxoglutarate transaminase